MSFLEGELAFAKTGHPGVKFPKFSLSTLQCPVFVKKPINKAF
jgi:hypothetical protein